MAIKPDKSRIMFTTDSSFEYFLRDRCLKENRNMSNLVDTILKNHYKEEYTKYLSSLDETIRDMLNTYADNDISSDFINLLDKPNILFSDKIEIINKIAYSNEDVNKVVMKLYNDLREEAGLDPYRLDPVTLYNKFKKAQED